MNDYRAPEGDWRQIVSADWQQERPKWPCSAYSHIKAAQGQQVSPQESPKTVACMTQFRDLPNDNQKIRELI